MATLPFIRDMGEFVGYIAGIVFQYLQYILGYEPRPVLLRSFKPCRRASVRRSWLQVSVIIAPLVDRAPFITYTERRDVAGRGNGKALRLKGGCTLCFRYSLVRSGADLRVLPCYGIFWDGGENEIKSGGVS